MKVWGLAKLNAFTKKQPITLLSVAFVLLVLLIVSNALVMVGLVKRDMLVRKMKKWLLFARNQGIKFSEDMTQELGLEDDEQTMVDEVKAVKSEMVSEGMEAEEENEEMPMEEIDEEEVMEDEEEVMEEPFSGEGGMLDYGPFQ